LTLKIPPQPGNHGRGARLASQGGGSLLLPPGPKPLPDCAADLQHEQRNKCDSAWKQQNGSHDFKHGKPQEQT